MSKKILVTILLLSIVVSLFLGCKQDMTETMEKVQAQVEISVQLPQELIGAGYDPDDCTFTLTWYPAGDVAKATEEAFDYDENKVIVFQFAPGTYTFDLTAKDKTTDDLKSDGSKTITIDPGQRVKLEIPLTYYDVLGTGTGLVMDKDTYTLTGAVKTDMTIVVPAGRKLIVAGGASIDNLKTLTVNGDVAIEDGATITGTLKVAGNLTIHGEVTVDGTLDLDGNGWEAVELGAGGSILLNKNTADFKLNGASTWYSLAGAKARYFYEDDTVQLRFIEGTIGASKVAPTNDALTQPTEAITRVGKNVTFELKKSSAGVPLNITNKEIIIEDEGELKQDQYWFGSGVYTATPSSRLIVMPLGEYFMTVSSVDNTIKRTVGQESKKNDGNWHNWKWVQNGTKTIIIPSTGEFQAIADSGSQIEISYSTGDVVTPITIESGVAATIPTGLNINMRRSTFVNHGTVEIYGTLDTSVKDSYPGGTLENYGTIYINAGGTLTTSREGSLTNEGSIVNTGGTWNQ